MATEISICRLALSHLRSNNADVVSITDPNTLEEEYCQTYYPLARDFVLSSHDWGFATRHEPLALKGTAPSGWLYQYGVPAKYLKAQSVYPKGSGDLPQPYEEGSIADAGDEVVIWTDTENAYLKFTAKVNSPSVYSPLFAMATSWMLAHMLAGALTKTRDVQNAMLEGYSVAMGMAAVSDANNQKLGGPTKTQKTYVPGKVAAGKG